MSEIRISNTATIFYVRCLSHCSPTLAPHEEDHGHLPHKFEGIPSKNREVHHNNEQCPEGKKIKPEHLRQWGSCQTRDGIRYSKTAGLVHRRRHIKLQLLSGICEHIN